jgi:hypothetical protein
METNNEYRKSNRMLLDERPLVLLPSLAMAVGVNEAIVIQQLHFYLADRRNGKDYKGEQWIYKTYEKWQSDDFPFWPAITIRRTFRALKERKLIISCQPEGYKSRQKYYRINYEVLDNLPRPLTRARAASDQNDRIEPIKMASSYSTESTAKTTATKKRVPAGACTISFVPNRPKPKSLRAMCKTLDQLGVEVDENHASIFLKEMRKANWTIRGEPVLDWVATYEARLQHVYDCTG